MNESKSRPPAITSHFQTPGDFLESVLALKPRLAVFDCDGTLWSGDGGEDFFYWEMAQKLIPAKIARWVVPRYADYRQGKVDEKQMCGEMVTIHAGLSLAAIEEAAERFFAQVLEQRIFLDMRALTAKLKATGCELWAVSSTNDWVIAAGVKRFGIPRERVLAASVEVADGLATDRLTQVPTDEDKALAIRTHIGRTPDVVFGNSIHDEAMLAMARNAFAVNPNPDLEEIAKQNGWRIYWPQAAWEVAGNLAQDKA
jgi:phosphoserine phosphatase